MKIIVATKNNGKLREFKRILEPLGYEVFSQADLGVDGQAEEAGSTFAENARLKARYVFEKTSEITIADDSGLCVDALDGRPGVYSARYGGPGLSDAERTEVLLRDLKDVPEGKRTAHFTCVIAVIFPDKEWSFCGTCDGEIAYSPKGENGFGYDPVFFVKGKSFAEINEAEKDAISHRGKALREMAARFEKEKSNR